MGQGREGGRQDGPSARVYHESAAGTSATAAQHGYHAGLHHTAPCSPSTLPLPPPPTLPPTHPPRCLPLPPVPMAPLTPSPQRTALTRGLLTQYLPPSPCLPSSRSLLSVAATNLALHRLSVSGSVTLRLCRYPLPARNLLSCFARPVSRAPSPQGPPPPPRAPYSLAAGRTMTLNICFPVHSSSGLSTAGVGRSRCSRPSAMVASRPQNSARE